MWSSDKPGSNTLTAAHNHKEFQPGEVTSEVFMCENPPLGNVLTEMCEQPITITAQRKTWVCGNTQTGEEIITLGLFCPKQTRE